MSIKLEHRNAAALIQILQAKACVSNSNPMNTVTFAQRAFGEDAMSARILQKAAISTGDFGNDPDYRAASAALLELVRTRSLLGKITGWRRVPFMTQVMKEVAVPIATWVKEGNRKPVTASNFDNTSLQNRKVAGIVPVTNEVLRRTGQQFTITIQQQIVRALAKVESESLIDPDNAGIADTAPPSITYGAPNDASTGNPEDDLDRLLDLFGGDEETMVIVTHPRTAVRLYHRGYENAGARGGDVAGIPLVTSTGVPFDSSGALLVAVDPARVLLADDGVNLDLSAETTLQFDGGESVSMFQTNTTAVLAERTLNWEAQAGAVAYLTGVDYAGG